MAAERIAYEVHAVPNAGWDDRVRVFRHGPVVDTCAVVTERYLVLVDSGFSPAGAAQEVTLLADVLPGRQLLVLNTHADWDHYWGNGAFSGPTVHMPAPILGHQIMLRRIASDEARETLARMKGQSPQTFADVRLIPPTLAFTPPLTIDGGDLTLEVIATPGHQPDHVAVWIPAIRLLWAADAAESPWPYANDPATLPALRASLARMAALDPAVALYCHAPGQTTPAVIAHNIAYFDALEARCRAALDARAVRGADARTHPPPADLPERVGFPGAAALPPDADPAVLVGYNDAHARNTQVMLAWLLHHADERSPNWPAL